MVSLSQFLGLVRGSTGIVSLESYNQESASTYRDDGWEKFVCRINSQPHSLTICWSENHFPNGRHEYYVTDKKEISEEEYACLVLGKKSMDTPEKLLNIRQRQELSQKLSQLIPLCPVCNTSMAERDGRFGKFWGCSKYARGCRGTRPIDSEYTNLQKQLNELGPIW